MIRRGIALCVLVAFAAAELPARADEPDLVGAAKAHYEKAQQLYLNGNGGGRQEADTPAVFKVPAGAYTIELAQTGWEPETHDVAVEIGQPYFYQYRLKRSTAQVTIFTRPRGARVFIDERLVGETPF